MGAFAATLCSNLIGGYSGSMPRVTFLGAAQTVTGSKYLVEHRRGRVLVDCGLFQGLKALRLRNWEPLPVAPAEIDAVVLTHAHLDHTGYLPRLVQQGFTGRAFCTPGTKDLCGLVLPDAARLQEEDAREANARGSSKHHPALPLFDGADAFHALERLQPVGFDRPMPVSEGVQVTFRHVGHLLGAAAAILTTDDPPRTFVFGGDLGRYDRPVLRDPQPVADADVLLVESTYGDRTHAPDDRGERLADIIRRTLERKGKVVIPAFALGRVEEVLYWIKRLEEEQRIPVAPVYLDSPMAVEALQFYVARHDELDAEFRDAVRPMRPFASSRFQALRSAQESMAIVHSSTPSIVVSSSGMATGGRVLRHLEQLLPDSRHTVLLVGYQAAGTRGRHLLDGARTVRIYGRDVPVAAEIACLDSLSAHADAAEIVRWLRGFRRPPSDTFIVHGEPERAAALQARIARELGPDWRTDVPAYLDAREV
jgi:metallo-beta-lactamase family protein